MSLSLEQILLRLEDPATPVVWLDPALPESLWENLPSYAASRGYQVLNLGDQGPIFDLDSLMAALGRLLGWPAAFDHSLPSLRQTLVGLPAPLTKGFWSCFPTLIPSARMPKRPSRSSSKRWKPPMSSGGTTGVPV
jgi:hypothetical protein